MAIKHSNPHYGRFTICKKATPWFGDNTAMWYVMEKKSPHKYVHSDGVLRISTMNEKMEFSGWFKTRKLARDAVNLFRSKN